MPKTRRDLFSAIADKVGGVRGERMREAIAKAPQDDPLLEQAVSDERFEEEMKKQECMPQSSRPGFGISGDSWRMLN